MNVTILSIMGLIISGLALQPIFADSELPPVYQNWQLILDKSQYTLGDTINVTVISPLNNTDPNALDTMMTADAHGFETKHVTQLSSRSLIESGPDTGIFVGKFQIIKSSDKPSENPESIDGYLEVSPDSDSISVMLKNILDGGISGMSMGFTHTSDQTPSDGFTNRTISAYPNAQFRWKESISPYEGIGIIRVVYPEQNISDKTIDTLVVRIISDYVSRKVYTTLTETGEDTGIFEAIIPITTQYSLNKLVVKPNQWTRIYVNYYVNDQLESDSDGFSLYSSLQSQDSEQRSNLNPITVHTDKDWYLSEQQIIINGQAEPNEELDIVIFDKKEAHEKFRHVTADSSGLFNTSVEWKDARFFSGQHIVEVIGSKHDEIAKKDITIVSLEALRSRSIDVSPKQQLDMGIPPSDIVCHQVWKLVLKPDGKTPTCLEPPTAFKLEKRGWTILQKADT